MNILSITFLSLNNKKKIYQALIYSVGQFSWGKYSHHGQFQVTNLMSLNTEVGGDVGQPTTTQCFYTDTTDTSNPKSTDNNKT